MRWRWILGGTVVYLSSAYAASLYVQSSKIPDNVRPLSEQHDTASIYARIAAKYDDDTDRSEWFTYVPWLRRRLLKSAQGSVLEVACGTGRNLKYYPESCVRVVATDRSNDMVLQTKAKLKQLADKRNASHPELASITEIQQLDATHLPFADNTFDTIVDTFGLCSCAGKDVSKLLGEMQRVCKPDGKILLLEHGRSHQQWLSNVLDRHADRHAQRWGCWWNRDVEKLVAESGIHIESNTKYHFGSTYSIVARPHKQSVSPPTQSQQP